MTTPKTLICGIDEVGRGCLAGPLVAVAALFKGWDVGCPDVDDSKKIHKKRRRKVFRGILWSPELIDFGIGQVSVEEINDTGIDRANATAFHRAVSRLSTRPNYLVVDGNEGVPGWGPNQRAEPKADGTYEVVGAASILAKVIRDAYMDELNILYPGYKWESNKGYGSKAHILGIRALGPTRFHRTKFISKIVNNQTEWSF